MNLEDGHKTFENQRQIKQWQIWWRFRSWHDVNWKHKDVLENPTRIWANPAATIKKTSPPGSLDSIREIWKFTRRVEISRVPKKENEKKKKQKQNKKKQRWNLEITTARMERNVGILFGPLDFACKWENNKRFWLRTWGIQSIQSPPPWPRGHDLFLHFDFPN